MKIVIRKYEQSDSKDVVKCLEGLFDYLIPLDPLKRLRRLKPWGPRYTKELLSKITNNKGAYIVKNELYTGTSLEFTELEKVMKQIRSECKKPCKINLYSDRKAYELDIMPGEDNFSGFTEEQKSYLRTHVLAFWGIDDGDSIEYYPSK